MDARPLFSIVIPAFNRAREIRRALDSCFSQELEDFEIVVVDDASTDDTAQQMSQYIDPRLRLARHMQNRGECPARATGVAHSRGEWVVFLDSDDALLPGALRTIAGCIAREHAAVDRFGFMYEWDVGGFSPDPRPEYRVLDYEGWMRWQDGLRTSNLLFCTRRSAFESVPLPTSSVAPTEYHLEFARRFSTRIVPLAAALQYTDAANRLTVGSARPERAHIVRRANDDAASCRRILRNHGAALRKHSSRTHELMWRLQALSEFLAGRAGRGLWQSWRYLISCRPTLVGVLSLSLAAVAPSLYLRARHVRQRVNAV